MSFFREIIFPPKPKPVEEEIDYISFSGDDDDKLYLKYWFEYTPEFIKFMVRCPTCGEVYCYSRLRKQVDTYDIESGIRDNSRYFNLEWIANCPCTKKHYSLLDEFRGLI